MNETGLRSISAAAKELDVRRETIGDLIIKLGLTPQPMTNGKAKGLTEQHMRKIRKALGMCAAATAATA